ncbi:MAG: indole-3-glycerol phosphate synthase TrpC [bacterium]
MLILYNMILDEIVFQKRQVVTALKVRINPKKKRKIKVRPFLKGKKFALIAEIKKASPSAGLLIKKLDPTALAKAYAKAGATAISVLTDEKFFQGKLADLKTARAATNLPVLRKDFVIDEAQIYEASQAGADAILLIVRILTEEQLIAFIKLAKSLKLAALVEVHNEEEARRAIKAGAEIIGINNRDLDTLAVDVKTTLRILDNVPELKDKIVISESGINSNEEVRALKACGVRGILVGESLLRAPDPAAKIKELLL